MNNYHEKYVKYKNKYLMMKKTLHGGATIVKNTENEIKEMLNGYTKYENTGRRNCGLYISENNNETLYLCKDEMNPIYIEYVNEINNNIKLFPSIVKVNENISNNNYYIEFEKLDGDLSELIFNKIPLNVIKNSGFPLRLKMEMIKLYKLRRHSSGQTSYTFNYNNDDNSIRVQPPNEENKNIYDDFIKNTQVTYSIFSTIMDKIMDKIEKTLNYLLKIIIKKIYQLYTLSFIHNDLKLDNFGYKMNGNNIENIENIEIFFIDIDSLVKFDVSQNEKMLNDIIELYNDKMKFPNADFIFQNYYGGYVRSNKMMDTFKLYMSISVDINVSFLMDHLNYSNDAAKITCESYTINYDKILKPINSLNDLLKIIDI